MNRKEAEGDNFERDIERGTFSKHPLSSIDLAIGILIRIRLCPSRHFYHEKLLFKLSTFRTFKQPDIPK